MKIQSLILSSIALLVFTSCDKDEPETPVVPNEEEVITSLTYTLVDNSTGAVAKFQYIDLDGDGGNPPVITADTLVANQVYDGLISLMNEIVDPPEDITEEVAEEADEHQFFYIPSNSDIDVNYTDVDQNDNPIGITTTLITGEPGSGTLTIILRHEPDKNASGVADGDITNAGGETDIEVVFNVVVE